MAGGLTQGFCWAGTNFVLLATGSPAVQCRVVWKYEQAQLLSWCVRGCQIGGGVDAEPLSVSVEDGGSDVVQLAFSV